MCGTIAEIARMSRRAKIAHRKMGGPVRIAAAACGKVHAAQPLVVVAWRKLLAARKQTHNQLLHQLIIIIIVMISSCNLQARSMLCEAPATRDKAIPFNYRTCWANFATALPDSCLLVRLLLFLVVCPSSGGSSLVCGWRDLLDRVSFSLAQEPCCSLRAKSPNASLPHPVDMAPLHARATLVFGETAMVRATQWARVSLAMQQVGLWFSRCERAKL